MNLRLPFVVCALGVGLSGEVSAQACTHKKSVPNLTTLLQSNTVCAALARDRWQEYHEAGGALYDWKRGPGDRVDPRERVGSWSIASVTDSNDTRDQVTHNYGAGNSFTYRVCQNGSVFTFQQVKPAATTTITGATIQGGSGACP